MRTRVSILIIVFLGLLGCSKERHNDVLLGGAIEPSAQGTWAGTLTINGVSSPMTITMAQTNIELQGTYDSGTGVSGQGTITGRTTGPTLTFKLVSPSLTCASDMQLGGQNNGTALNLNLTGSCNGQTLNGQTTLTKQ